MDIGKFIEKGYDIFPADNLDELKTLREKIFLKAREMVQHEGDDIEFFFNNFHKYEVRGPSLNNLRMELGQYCSEQLQSNRMVFDAFRDSLTQLLGPDVVVQKTTNLVIQQPGDPDRVAIHRDAPLNSPFEIVVWLPLVDVFGTKSMWVLDKDNSQKSLVMWGESQTGYQNVSEFAEQQGEILMVPFGHGCMFWPGLVHGVEINAEHETRWAINIRYKNLFAPAGDKGQAEFFEVLQLSPLTRIALEFEKEAHG